MSQTCSKAALLVLALIFCCCRQASAVPMGRTVTFEQGPLPETFWRLVEGDVATVSTAGQRLLISPGASATRLVYRYYPLRLEAERPAFGDFHAELEIHPDGAAGMVGFGITDDGGFSLLLEYDAAGRRARLLRVHEGKTAAGEWSEIPYQGSALILRLARRGHLVLGQVCSGDKATPVGCWKGRLAPIVDFAISAARLRPDEPVRAAISRLNIMPFHLESAYSEILPRPSQDLPGDENLPERYRDAGGNFEGGYIWGKEDEASVRIRVANALDRENRVLLNARLTDWQDRQIKSAQVPVTLAPLEEKEIRLRLPAGRFGFYHLTTFLQTEEGEPLEAAKTLGCAVTAAPPAAELAEDCSFGVHAWPMARTGAKWVRYWDIGGTFLWSHVEREKGVWDWEHADAYLQRVEATGQKPLVVLAGTPAWASSDTSYVNYMGRGSHSPPRDVEDWKEYCRRVVQRYKGRVKHYEVWNEPNNSELQPRGYFFYGPVEEYFKLLKAAYEAVKEVDPDAVVLGPSGTGHFFPFLERLCELGGMDYFDILSIHTYCTPFPPEIGYQFNGEKSYRHRVERSREIMARHGQVKPIWNTEIGYHSGLHIATAGLPFLPDQIAAEGLPEYWPNWWKGWPFRPQDSRRIAAFVSRFIILSHAYGVEKVFYHHSLVSEGGHPDMPLPAVGWASFLMTGAQFRETCDWGEDIQAHVFNLKDGRTCVAYWRVEPETLLMARDREEKVGNVESAPVAGIAEQEGITPAVTVAEKPTRYFRPDRAVPVAVRLPSLRENRAGAVLYDLWGNLLPVPDALPVEEAPHYLVLPAGAMTPMAEVERSAPADLEVPPMLCEAGSLVPLDENTLRRTALVDSPFKLLPKDSVDVSILGVRMPDGKGNTAGAIRVHEQEETVWTLPENTPARGRIMMSVRSSDRQESAHNYTYSIIYRGRAMVASPWPVWPNQIYGVGEGWSETQGMVMTPAIDLQAGETFVVKCHKNEGRIYGLRIIPQP